MTRVANSSCINTSEIIAALNALESDPRTAAFVTEDGYIDLPLIFDHEDVIRPLISDELYELLDCGFSVLQELLFPETTDVEPTLCQANADLLKTLGWSGECITDLRNYRGSEMYVINSPIGKIVIG